MKWRFECSECNYEEDGHNDEVEAENSALEHMAYSHPYTIESYYPDGSYGYRQIT
jgi:hypothetical protein